MVTTSWVSMPHPFRGVHYFGGGSLQDEEEDNVADDSSPLDTPLEELDTLPVREKQRITANRRNYIKCFPFDVLNFDLERFFFTPNDPIPGKMVKALRKICDWQKRVGEDRQGRQVSINSFSLMFTTQVGPPNLTNDYLEQLEECLLRNINGDQSLRTAFSSRVGHDDVRRLRQDEFGLFFKLAVPKVLASILKETDWMIDSQKGIKIFEINRHSTSGDYQMLHLTMQVNRQPPHLPGVQGSQVDVNHSGVVEKLFREHETQVTEGLIEATKHELQEDLDRILARRRKYVAGKH